MASSEVAICNQALGWLGGELITSFSDNSDEAKLCSANYALLRDAVLEEREWTFAVERIELSRLAAVPKYGFNYQFQIPATVIRVLQVSRKGDSNGIVGTTERYGTGLGSYDEVLWLKEGTTIRTNASEIYARVLQQVTDPTKHSPAFDQALAARIAMDLAIPLTNSRTLQKDMAAMYGEKIALAAASDGLQGRSLKVRSTSLINVR